MRIREFLKFVEIRTKLCSIMPLFIALTYSLWKFRAVNLELSIFFLISMLFIDMATTGLNNYMDYKKAILKDGYNYKEHNAMVAYGLDEKIVIKILILLYFIGFLTGMYLVYKTDVVVLMIGFIGAGIGFLYSAGPIPISHSPYGEIVSGITMGLFIFFVGVYIQVDFLKEFNFAYQSIGAFSLPKGEVSIVFNISSFYFILELLLLSIPIILPISNIMLANNMCTVDDDVANRRYTLPYYIGIKKSAILFKILHYSSYILLILYSIIGLLPISTFLFAIVFIYNKKSRSMVDDFCSNPDKKHNFVYSVKLFLILSTGYAISLLIGYLYGVLV